MTRSASTFAAFFAALLTSIAAPSVGRAQDSVPVAPGARVRAYVVPPGAWRVGALDRLTADSLFLRADGCASCAGVAMPRSAVSRFEASAGRGGHPFRGMALGLVAGAAIGAFVVAPCPHGNRGGDGPPCGLGQGLAAVYGGFGGLLVGGIAGAYWPSKERWRPARVTGDTRRIGP